MKEYIKFDGTFLFGCWCLMFSKDSEYKIYHRENDKPAIIFSDGRKHWWIYGKLIKYEDK